MCERARSTNRRTAVERDSASTSSPRPGSGSGSLGNVPWSGLLYYWGEGGSIIRVDMNTFEKQVMFSGSDAPEPRKHMERQKLDALVALSKSF